MKKSRITYIQNAIWGLIVLLLFAYKVYSLQESGLVYPGLNSHFLNDDKAAYYIHLVFYSLAGLSGFSYFIYSLYRFYFYRRDEEK